MTLCQILLLLLLLFIIVSTPIFICGAINNYWGNFHIIADCNGEITEYYAKYCSNEYNERTRLIDYEDNEIIISQDCIITINRLEE